MLQFLHLSVRVIMLNIVGCILVCRPRLFFLSVVGSIAVMHHIVHVGFIVKFFISRVAFSLISTQQKRVSSTVGDGNKGAELHMVSD